MPNDGNFACGIHPAAQSAIGKQQWVNGFHCVWSVVGWPQRQSGCLLTFESSIVVDIRVEKIKKSASKLQKMKSLAKYLYWLNQKLGTRNYAHFEQCLIAWRPFLLEKWKEKEKKRKLANRWIENLFVFLMFKPDTRQVQDHPRNYFLSIGSLLHQKSLHL